MAFEVIRKMNKLISLKNILLLALSISSTVVILICSLYYISFGDISYKFAGFESEWQMEWNGLICQSKYKATPDGCQLYREVIVGFPLPSFQMKFCDQKGAKSLSTPVLQHGSARIFNSNLFDDLAQLKLLPLGIVVDISIYYIFLTMAWKLVASGFENFYFKHRMKQDRCIYCNYPLIGFVICPECGRSQQKEHR